MLWLQWTVAGALAAWLLVTLLNQIKPIKSWVRPLVAYDIMGLVPIWTFFAPRPGDTDTHLLYRDLSSDRYVGPWREVPLSRRRNVFHLWQPTRRVTKAIVDVTPTLAAPASDTESGEDRASMPPERMVSFPYLLVLNHVCRQPREPFSHYRQFAVARTPGREGRSSPSILFISGAHRLERTDGERVELLEEDLPSRAGGADVPPGPERGTALGRPSEA